MTFERQQLITGDRIPYLARSIIAPRYELISRLVEGAVSQRQNMCA